MKSFIIQAVLLALPSLTRAGGPLRKIPWNPPSSPPNKTRGDEQLGYNDCFNYPDSPNAMCQTSWANNINDFCIFAPPKVERVGDSERYNVVSCLAAGHGARLFPANTIAGMSWITTAKYIQITAVGDFTKLKVPKGDDGGELDPYGYDSLGNPVGGLFYGTGPNKKPAHQFVHWIQFLSDDEMCARFCFEDRAECEHKYDEMGCHWVIPGKYKKGTFETCDGDVAEPIGVYTLKNGQVSTWHQGDKNTPAAHPIPKSSNCVTQATLAVATYGPKTSSKPSTSSKPTSTPKTTSKTTSKVSATSKPASTTKKTTTTKKSSSTSKVVSSTKKASSTSTKKASSTSSKKSTSSTVKKASATSSKKPAATKPGTKAVRDAVVMGLGERGWDMQEENDHDY